MTGLNHAVTGALVAAAVNMVTNKPAIALVAALVSHFIADAIPHWNYYMPHHLARRQLLMLADLSLSLGLLLVLALSVDANPYLVIAGGLLGVLPDTMWLRFLISGRPSIQGSPKRLINRIRQFHFWIQWSESGLGLVLELTWFLLMLGLIYQIHQ